MKYFSPTLLIILIVLCSCQTNDDLTQPLSSQAVIPTVGELLFGDYLMNVYPLSEIENLSLDGIRVGKMTLHERGTYEIELFSDEYVDYSQIAPLISCRGGTYLIRLQDGINAGTLVNVLQLKEGDSPLIIGTILFSGNSCGETAGVLYNPESVSISLVIPDGRFNTWAMIKSSP
jgi:hypothetical protein